MRGRLGEQVLTAFSQTKTRPLPASISNSSASPFTLSPFNRATRKEYSFPPLFPDSASNSKTESAPSSAQLFTSFTTQTLQAVSNTGRGLPVTDKDAWVALLQVSIDKTKGHGSLSRAKSSINYHKPRRIQRSPCQFEQMLEAFERLISSLFCLRRRLLLLLLLRFLLHNGLLCLGWLFDGELLFLLASHCQGRICFG